MYQLVIKYMDFKAEFHAERNKTPKILSNSVTLHENTASSCVQRGSALCKQKWETFFNKDGRIINESAVRKAIFKGGINSDIRPEVWSFLFGFYTFSSSARERQAIKAERMIQYNALKERWKKELTLLLSKDEESAQDFYNYLHPSYYKDDINKPNTINENISFESQQLQTFLKKEAEINVNKKKIDVVSLKHFLRTINKDVPRTDRNLEFYQEPKNLLALRNILLTYVAFSPGVGYTQGMNDLVSRFHSVLKSEYKTYYCFVNFMERVEKEFLEHGMIQKLELIQTLLKKMDKELYDFFKSLEINELLFCHRWLLLNFKREFEYEDSLKVFEITSSHHLELWSVEAEKERRRQRVEELKNQDGQLYEGIAEVDPDFTFDLFICLAILVLHRKELSECDDISLIYNTLNSLSMHIDLDIVLVKAEALFFNYCRNSVADCFQIVNYNT